MIGQGAYGIVYKGRKDDTNETVAIKRIPFADTTPEGGVPCNVIREISLLRELDHPNVVRVYLVLVFQFISLVGEFAAGLIVTPLTYHLLARLRSYPPGQTLGHYSSASRWSLLGL